MRSNIITSAAMSVFAKNRKHLSHLNNLSSIISVCSYARIKAQYPETNGHVQCGASRLGFAYSTTGIPLQATPKTMSWARRRPIRSPQDVVPHTSAP
jgi:hypothetical protein